MHPTDSSINVALGQGNHAPPAGLSLHVADAAGRFKPVATGLGFPAGKDKTVLIDLGGSLPRQRDRAACGLSPTSRSSGTGSDGPPAGRT